MHMKIRKLITAAAVLSLCACTGTPGEPDTAPSEAPAETPQDALAEYTELASAGKKAESAALSVRCTYTMNYGNDAVNMYSMDGAMEYDSHDTAHLTQYMNANGMQFEQEGWYYGGRLYFDYNSVTFYEDMSFENAKALMLVPLTPYTFTRDMLETYEYSDGTYTFRLKAEPAEKLFVSRYDIYGINESSSPEVKEAVITDRFDEEGRLKGESAVFTLSVIQDGSPVEISYESSFEASRIGVTEVKISDETRKAQSAYVSYSEVDPSSITPLAPEDEPGDTAEETFRRRLVSRLGYKENPDGTYETSYNDSESYRIDFTNKTFVYTRHSVAYAYSWKGETGTMGECSYDFNSGVSSSACKDTTLETIREVRSWLELELYYCGLRLADLQAEG